jgi:hypothetical protein
VFAVDVCDLPETGGSTFVLIAGVFLLVAGVIVARWVRQSAGRMSVVVAPLVLLSGFVLVPQVTDPCAPATTTVPSATTTVPSATTTTVAPTTTTTVPSATTTTVAPTTTTTTTTTTTLAPVVYQVGGAGPSGGIVFYDAGSVQSWGRYLEVACAGWSDGTCGGNDLTDPRATWGCSGTSITGADGTAIGTGGQNTTAIVTGCVTSDITAAERADALVLGGQSDWFLPSKDELSQMYINLHSASTPLGGFSTDYYWSSSENFDYNAWYQYFSYGSQISGSKDTTTYVRPVRAF